MGNLYCLILCKFARLSNHYYLAYAYFNIIQGSHVLLNMRRLHARVNALTVSSSLSHITTPQGEFAMTTYTEYQLDGSTDSIRIRPVDAGLLPTHRKDTIRSVDHLIYR